MTISKNLNILVLQHVPVEHPGSFRDAMTKGGHSWHSVELDKGDAIPELGSYDAMLVMGGPMDVWQEGQHPWLREEKAAIREWIKSGRPFLGMCLGAQLFAEAMGGRVGAMQGAPEVGFDHVTFTDDGDADPLFQGIDGEGLCFQWHGAEVQELPPGCRLLATSVRCHVQAFAWGGCAYGLQYHLELTNATAREWGAIPEYADALTAAFGDGALKHLEHDIAGHLPQMQSLAGRLFANFAAIATRNVAAPNAPIQA